MALTNEQIQQIRGATGLDQGGVNVVETDRMSRLRKIAEQSSGKTQISFPEEEYYQSKKKRGILGTIASEIVKPATRFATSAINVGEAISDVVRGDVTGAQEALQKTRNFGPLGESIEPILTGKETPGEMAKKVAGSGAELASTFFGGGAAKTGITGLIKTGVLKGLSKEALAQAARVGSITGAFGFGGREAQENGDLEDVLLYSAIGGVTGGITAPVLTGLARVGSNKIKEVLQPVTEKVSSQIRESISKGIKPYFSSATTKSQINKYYRNAEDAFATIYKYRPEVMDVEQGIRVEKLPTTRAEMLDALESTKKEIFTKYDDLARQAGEAGVVFDAIPVVDELRRVTQSKTYSPEIRNYAERMINEVAELQGESPLVVQERIKELNSSLGSFFAGRTDKAKAQVDASIANKMRQVLDDLIETSGEGYQVLRNQYSALKTIEKDLTRQVALEARKNTKGLIDMTDIFTGSELITGLVTGNPASLVAGMTGKAIKEYQKYLNNPNRYIKKAFDILSNPPKDIKKTLENLIRF